MDGPAQCGMFVFTIFLPWCDVTAMNPDSDVTRVYIYNPCAMKFAHFFFTNVNLWGFCKTYPWGKCNIWLQKRSSTVIFPLGDSRNIEESFFIYEKKWKKIVSGPKKSRKSWKKYLTSRHIFWMSVLLSEKSFPFRVLKVLAFFTYFHFPCWGLWFIRRFYGLRFFYRYRFASYRLGIFRKFSERT